MVSEKRHDVRRRADPAPHDRGEAYDDMLTVIGAVLGGAAGYALGVFVACSVLIPQANTCGLFAVFITFPLGLLGGGAAGTRLARRWQPPAALGAVLLISVIALIAGTIAILLFREPATRRRPTVSPATTLTVAPASAPPVAAATPVPVLSSSPLPPSPAATTRTAPQGPLRVVEVTLRAEPSDYSGPCPGRITFRGTIRTTGGSGRLSYRFTRSDKATAPIETIDVASASVHEVETTWAIGAYGYVVEGWQALEVVAPQPLTSARARFRTWCGEGPPPRR
jgi:hypothetical protein